MSQKPESLELGVSSFERDAPDANPPDSKPETRTSNLEPRASPISRRVALKVLGAAPIIGVTAFAEQQQQQQQTRQTHEAPNQPARDTKQPAPSQPKSKFFTQRELRTVRVLADDVIPRDERSGSATDAKVPEFMDFNLSVEETTPETRIAWRGGLRWMDTESRRRFGVPYASASSVQRHQILDDIAWPDRARPELRHGAAFFARFRDMAAAGFFSSAIGFKDLQYMGNTFVPVWNGCPEAALRKLGVSYDDKS
jgi:gluconate 2-dehydrogenase subunit 3-like protein